MHSYGVRKLHPPRANYCALPSRPTTDATSSNPGSSNGRPHAGATAAAQSTLGRRSRSSAQGSTGRRHEPTATARESSFRCGAGRGHRRTPGSPTNRAARSPTGSRTPRGCRPEDGRWAHGRRVARIDSVSTNIRPAGQLPSSGVVDHTVRLRAQQEMGEEWLNMTSKLPSHRQW